MFLDIRTPLIARDLKGPSKLQVDVDEQVGKPDLLSFETIGHTILPAAQLLFYLVISCWITMFSALAASKLSQFVPGKPVCNIEEL